MDDATRPCATDAGDAPAARRRWLGVLARAASAELERLLAAVPRREQLLAGHVVLRAPEIGMVMLRGRAAGSGGAFNLGEASVTRCTVRLADGTLGTGYTLGRARRKAELIALCDALLQRDPALSALLVEPPAARQAAQRDAASRAAAATRVEFFTVVRGA